MKPLNELNALDNFMFNELLNQPDIDKSKYFCKIILERVLGIKVRILDIGPQTYVQGLRPDRHGVTMDAWIKAVNEETATADVSVTMKYDYYDLEPNLYSVPSEPKRIRYYHSAIDSNIFGTGTPYADLPNVVIIMISDYDMFGQNRMVYTLQRRCVELPDMEYDDGQKTIILYTDGEPDFVDKEHSKKLSDMLHFLKDSSALNTDDNELTDIDSMIKHIKHSGYTEGKYMHTYDLYLHHKEEGRIQGLTEGLEKGRANTQKAYIIQLLNSKGTVSDDLKNMIESESDTDRLQSYFNLAITAQSVEEFESSIQ